MKRRIKIVALTVVLASIGIAALAAIAAPRIVAATMARPHRGFDGEHVDVVVPPGTSARATLERLEREGVIRSATLARVWLRLEGGGASLQAGEYRFAEADSAIGVIERLRAGDVLLYPITIPEGLTFEEVADRLEAAGFGDRARYLELFGDPTPIADLVPEAPDLEGYLFPDTYHFPSGVRPAEVRDAMVRGFREVADERLAERAARVGLSLHEAVVLASLIEEETSLAEERARVSRVFHNRIERGMRMQCDPTVLYAHRRIGVSVDRLTYAHLRLDSPWNTYVTPGLPPTPIANPGRDSLIAAVEPAEGDELYFVARPDGGHQFSATLAQHNRAVAEWRRHRARSGG